MAIFKNKISSIFQTNIIINNKTVGLKFVGWHFTTNSEELIKALRGDSRYGVQFFEVKEDIPSPAVELLEEGALHKDVGVDNLPASEGDILYFRTVNEARDYLVKEKGAPVSNVNTSKGAIMWASANGIKLVFGDKETQRAASVQKEIKDNK